MVVLIFIMLGRITVEELRNLLIDGFWVATLCDVRRDLILFIECQLELMDFLINIVTLQALVDFWVFL